MRPLLAERLIRILLALLATNLLTAGVMYHWGAASLPSFCTVKNELLGAMESGTAACRQYRAELLARSGGILQVLACCGGV